MLCFVETSLNSRKSSVIGGSYCRPASLASPQSLEPAAGATLRELPQCSVGLGGVSSDVWRQGWISASGGLPPADFLPGSRMLPAPSTKTTSSSKLSLVGKTLTGKSKVVPCNLLALPKRGYFLHHVFGICKINLFKLRYFTKAIKSQN